MSKEKEDIMSAEELYLAIGIIESKYYNQLVPLLQFDKILALIQDRDKSIKKAQKEICALEYSKYFADSEEDPLPDCIYDSILNAPDAI